MVSRLLPRATALVVCLGFALFPGAATDVFLAAVEWKAHDITDEFPQVLEPYLDATDRPAARSSP